MIEDYDRHIRADEVKVGDQLHLTVMGGDEYVHVEVAEEVEPGKVRLAWTWWSGFTEDVVSADQKVRVRN